MNLVMRRLKRNGEGGDWGCDQFRAVRVDFSVVENDAVVGVDDKCRAEGVLF